jgi:hypothetical protein
VCIRSIVPFSPHSFCLHARACSWDHGCDDNSEETAEAEAVAADIASGRQTDMFWFDEAVFEGTTLPGDEGKDHLMYPPTTVITARRLQVEGAFRADESARTPPRNQDHQADDAEKLKQKQPDEAKGIAVDVGPAVPVPDQRDVQVVTSPEENVSVEGNHLMMILCFSSSSVRLFFYLTLGITTWSQQTRGRRAGARKKTLVVTPMTSMRTRRTRASPKVTATTSSCS